MLNRETIVGLPGLIDKINVREMMFRILFCNIAWYYDGSPNNTSPNKKISMRRVPLRYSSECHDILFLLSNRPIGFVTYQYVRHVTINYNIPVLTGGFFEAYMATRFLVDIY